VNVQGILTNIEGNREKAVIALAQKFGNGERDFEVYKQSTY